MNEENNRKGPGVFYAVIGVATLVVAIIGATFAYFSASVDATGNDTIKGEANAISAEDLSLTVTRVNAAPTNATSINLVPTDIDGSNATSINTAVAAKCEANGYTGCHIYKISAKSDYAIEAATVQLDSLAVTAPDGITNLKKDSWKYAIYKGTDATATEVVKNGSFDVTNAAPVEIHNAALGTTETVYYMIVYIANEDSQQNDTTKTNSVMGSYTGAISMNVAGGKVSATFTA